MDRYPLILSVLGLTIFLLVLSLSMAGFQPSTDLLASIVSALFVIVLGLSWQLGKIFRIAHELRSQQLGRRIRTLQGYIETVCILSDHTKQGPRVFGQQVSDLWESGAAAPDLIEYLVQLILLHRPERIAELGPGLSTLVMALTVRQIDQGHIFSLEHNSAWITIVREKLDSIGLSSFVTLKESPLEQQLLGDKVLTWYRDVDWLQESGPFDLVFVDGPPANRPEHPGREGALYALWDAMRPGACLLLDDGNRPGETACVEQWCRKYGTQITTYRIPLQKGLWVIEKVNADG